MRKNRLFCPDGKRNFDRIRDNANTGEKAMFNNEEQLKLEVKESLEKIVNHYSVGVDKSNKVACPICRSGTGHNRSSAFSIRRTGSGDLIWTCHSANHSPFGKTSGDSFTLIEQVENEPNFARQVEIACQILGISRKPALMPQKSTTSQKTIVDMEKPNSFKKTTLKSKITHISDQRVFDFISDCHAKSKNNKIFVDYMFNRGFTLEDSEEINGFRLGLCDQEIRTKYSDICRQSAIFYDSIIIPYNESPFFFARSINGNDKKKFKNESETGEPIKEPIFNEIALTSESPIFICEGQFDSLSLDLLGFDSIALGGGGFLDKLSKIKSLSPRKTFVLCGDDDKSGREFNAKLRKELQDYHDLIDFDWALIFDFLTQSNEDINSIAKKQAKTIKSKITQFVNLELEKLAEEKERLEDQKSDEVIAYRRSAYDSNWATHDFLSGIIEDSRNAISTGYKALDDIMNGGLTSALYVIGSIPSMGKSTICLNIADNIARSGIDILYFSVEMSRSQLLQKSIARQTYEWSVNNNKHIETHSSSLSDWLNPTTEQEQVLTEVFAEYGRIAQHKITIDCTCDKVSELNAMTIIERVKEHIDKTGRKPVVFVDYLQILADIDDGKNESDKKKLDKSIKVFKSLASTEKIPVVLISSLNRKSYQGASLDSGSGSGGIEYSADSFYVVVPDRDFYLDGKEDKEVSDLDLSELCKADQEGMKIALKCLKNRMGQSQSKARFTLIGKYSILLERQQTKAKPLVDRTGGKLDKYRR